MARKLVTPPWIKMRESLHEDPAVLEIAIAMGERPEHVVGYCHKFWSWVSRNCHASCVTSTVHGVTLEALENVLAPPGFLSLMCRVGCLEYDDTGETPAITIPKFDRHLSQGAKQRVVTAERKRRERASDDETGHGSVPDMSRNKRDKSVTRERERERERDPKDPPIVPHDGAPSPDGATPPAKPKAGEFISTEAEREIYQAYPKKSGRLAALKAIRKSLTIHEPAFLLDRVQAYAAAVSRWSADDRKFVKNPATWFNSGCFDDDPATWERNQLPAKSGNGAKSGFDFEAAKSGVAEFLARGENGNA